MKKLSIFLSVIVALAATSCEFKSKEVPINGTNLVTYTIENSDKVGVKEPGETGEILLSAVYSSVAAYGNYLWVKTEEGADDFSIVSLNNGKEIVASAKILEEGSNYRIIHNGKRKCYISAETDKIGPPYDELFVAQVHGKNYIFCLNTGGWGITSDDRFINIFPNSYDKIFIVSSEEGNKVYFLGHKIKSYNDKVWSIGKKMDGKYLDQEAGTDAEIESLIANLQPKWTKENGAFAVYEK
ncbi:MAG: hypothetical protein LBR08_10605 [Bacteroidales bacterium]|jgi:hypothetical protein|nr:hypothetical protein [Bacteroidales bacterium]